MNSPLQICEKINKLSQKMFNSSLSLNDSPSHFGCFELFPFFVKSSKKSCVIAILHGKKIDKKSLFLPKKWFFEQIRRKPTVEKRLYMFQNDRNTGFRLSTCCQTEQNLHRFISILTFFVSIYPKLEHICNVLHCFISGVFEETIKILEFRSVLLMGTWKIFVFSYTFFSI